MLVPLRLRNAFKSALGLSNAKLIYARITLTRHTTLYFTLTLFSCLLLSALHSVILADNTKAVDILYDSLRPSQKELGLSPQITKVVQGWLEVCDGIPGGETRCRRVVDLSGEGRSKRERRRALTKRTKLSKRVADGLDLEEGSEELRKRKREILSRVARVNRRQTNSTLRTSSDESDSEGGDSASSSSDESEDRDEVVGGVTVPLVISQTPAPTPSSTFIPPVTGSPTPTSGITTTPTPSPPTATGTPRGDVPANQVMLIQDEECLHALSWLEEGLHNSQREDVTLLFANLWMGVIGVVAILTESLPHLLAAFLAHVLSGAWSASRIQHTQSLTAIYHTIFMGSNNDGICANTDLLGGWWEERMGHTIPIVVVNVLTILLLGWLSWKLFKVYNVQTFSRVGASPAVLGMYRLLLSFSVLLQLTAFFSFASASLWISKASSGVFIQFAKHWKVYAGVFGVFIFMLVPWVILGWRCMRKECRTRVIMFFTISLVLLGISSVMFASGLYRTIFNRWSFFAAITVTSFILLVFTTILGIVCRINFGKGLTQYLDVSEALDGADFTPVHFDHRPDEKDKSKSKEKKDPEFGYGVGTGWATFNNEAPPSASTVHQKSASTTTTTTTTTTTNNTFAQLTLPAPEKAYRNPIQAGNSYDPAYHRSSRSFDYGSYNFTIQPTSVSPNYREDPFQTATELTSAEIDRMVSDAKSTKNSRELLGVGLGKGGAGGVSSVKGRLARESVWSTERSPIKLSYTPTIIRGGPSSTRRTSSASSIPEVPRNPFIASPQERIEQVQEQEQEVMDIRRGARGEFKALEVLPPSVESSPQTGLKSRWSATTMSTLPLSIRVPPFTNAAGGRQQGYGEEGYESKTQSVISASQYPHPKLRVANPDAYRASLASTVAAASPRTRENAPVPPIPIPTTGGSPTGRGMRSAFPVVPQRI